MESEIITDTTQKPILSESSTVVSLWRWVSQFARTNTLKMHHLWISRPRALKMDKRNRRSVILCEAITSWLLHVSRSHTTLKERTINALNRIQTGADFTYPFLLILTPKSDGSAMTKRQRAVVFGSKDEAKTAVDVVRHQRRKPHYPGMGCAAR